MNVRNRRSTLEEGVLLSRRSKGRSRVGGRERERESQLAEVPEEQKEREGERETIRDALRKKEDSVGSPVGNLGREKK